MLTQSEHALLDLEPALLGMGHEVLRWPLIRTVPLAPPALRAAASRLRACRWLLFTSPAAVRAWCLRPTGSTTPHDEPLLGAVGPGTAAALKAAGLPALLTAEGDAVSLANAFLAHPLAAGPVGLPVGDRALDTVRDSLTAGGHEVVTAVVYRTETLPAPPPGKLSPPPDVVFLASPSAVAELPAQLSANTTLVAIGSTTAAAVRATGRNCRLACAPTVNAALAVITGTTVAADEASGPSLGEPLEESRAG